MRRLLTISVVALASVAPAAAQNSAFNSSRTGSRSAQTNAFNRDRSSRDFNDARTNLNAKYAEMIRGKWGGFNSQREIPVPDRDVKPVDPKPYTDDDKEQIDRDLKIDQVITPRQDRNRATPIAPVNVNPSEPVSDFTFTYLGTEMAVKIPKSGKPTLSRLNEDGIAESWLKLSEPDFAATVSSCQNLRSRHKLCDWAYLRLLDAFTAAYCNDANTATLLMAYIFSQSGYKIRLAVSGSTLDMLFATGHTLYNRPYFDFEGVKFYPYRLKGGNIQICKARFDKETSLSLWVQSSPELSLSSSPQRTISSKRYPQFTVTSSVNKNLISFFDSYPTSEVGQNFVTRWAMYANTPASAQMRQNLYPQLKSLIAGLDELEAAERLLNWVQTGFVYEYDDKVWGGDRAFFAEETLYYPYADCEDRSILFTRLVRDLLGLKCILVYYPGHLACAVAFNSNVAGDYITTAGRRFTITDPTYIGAPVGRTMTGMNNSGATVIVLE